MRKSELSLDNSYLKIFDIESPDTLQKLKEYNFYNLIISGGYSDFKDLTNLQSAVDKITKIMVTTFIKDAQGLYQLINLTEIDFDTNINIFPKGFLFDFKKFDKLRKVTLYWNNSYKEIFSSSTIEDIDISKYKGDFTKFTQMRSLKKILFKLSSFNDLNHIDQLENLEILWIYQVRKLTDISALAYHKSLKSIVIEKIGTQDIEVLKKIKGLEEIGLGKEYNFNDFNFFKSFTNLKTLNLDGQITNYNFEELFNLPEIEKIRLIKQKSFNETEDYFFKLANQFNKRVKVNLMGKRNKTIIIEFFH